MINDYFLQIKNEELKNKIKELNTLGITQNELISSIFLDNQYVYDYLEKIEQKRFAHIFIKEIASCLRELKADDESKFIEVIHKYLKTTLSNDVRVVTFNYDTLIDDYYNELTYGIDINQNPYNDINYHTDGIWGENLSITNLHGSINWFKFSEDEKADTSNVFYCNKSDESYLNIIERQAPVIIPFTFNKNEYLKGNVFDLLWKKFNQLLERCESIELIGYSFPESDYHIITKVGNVKHKIKRIIVKEDDSTKIDRLRNIFGNCVVNEDAQEIFK